MMEARSHVRTTSSLDIDMLFIINKGMHTLHILEMLYPLYFIGICLKNQMYLTYMYHIQYIL